MTYHRVGLLLIGYDKDNIQPALDNLEETLDYPVLLYIAVTSGIGFRTKLPHVVHTFELGESLTVTMNRAYKYLMGECEYVGWFHPDMRAQKNWLSSLVRGMRAEVGKLSAYNPLYSSGDEPEEFHGQEQCYIIRSKVLEEIGLFDERYIGIGGYEDWDMNNRLTSAGYGVLITKKSTVNHVGMETRKGRLHDEKHNYDLFHSLW